MELLKRGVAGWRITVRRTQDRAATLDALVRTGAAFLRTDPDGLEEAIELGWLPGDPHPRVGGGRLPEEALDAIAAGAVDLVVGDWDADAVGRLRDAIAPRPCRAHRPAGGDRDRRRPRRPRPAPVHRLARPGRRLRRQPPPLHLGARPRRGPAGARRLSAEWEDDAWRGAAAEEGLGRLDPDLAGILERSLPPAPRVAEIERLFRARGHEVEAVAKVADALRRAATATRSPTSSTGTSTTPTSATSAAASAASAAARRASTCAATRTS